MQLVQSLCYLLLRFVMSRVPRVANLHNFYETPTWELPHRENIVKALHLWTFNELCPFEMNRGATSWQDRTLSLFTQHEKGDKS